MKNDIVGISQASDIQDEPVWVRCCPSQIAQIVVTEPDHYPVPVRSIIFSKTEETSDHVSPRRSLVPENCRREGIEKQWPYQHAG